MLRREFLTPVEVAQLMGVSERHVRTLARKGDLPGYKVGKLWRFDIEKIKRHCSNRVKEVTS